MLLGRLTQLLPTMLQRALGQQVQSATAAIGNPVDAFMTINET